MICHFFNEYGYESQDAWTGTVEQLKVAGYNEDKVENVFGKGWSDNSVYPHDLDEDGGFMSRNEQLTEVNPNLDINEYELEYGKGYVKK